LDTNALATLAANTIVAAAVTDAFEGLRARVARLFGRGDLDPSAKRRLDATRERLAVAAPGELDDARAAQARQWATRVADLLADHPEAAAELQDLIGEFRSALPDEGGSVRNTISGNVSHGPVLMGRDFGDITIGPADDRPR
jgi:hypothetical protein